MEWGDEAKRGTPGWQGKCATVGESVAREHDELYAKRWTNKCDVAIVAAG